ncbi:hypothetical protein KY285_015986 [Solanum tuberosum]|nr:hypothetical protein KY289_016189 [Solanum tuberosum]KAH0701708.1 hypothetical protein KY285_015986 [Solanum tuberosum]
MYAIIVCVFRLILIGAAVASRGGCAGGWLEVLSSLEMAFHQWLLWETPVVASPFDRRLFVDVYDISGVPKSRCRDHLKMHRFGFEAKVITDGQDQKP